jgi:TonB family protein
MIMPYKVLVRKTTDRVRATGISAEIARLTGNTPEFVYSVITAKDACIRSGASGREALRLRDRFEKIGARVDLVGPPELLVPNAVAPDTGDDEEKPEGRLLSEEEYLQRLREKPGLRGKITVRFAIDEYGNVIYCELAESTLGDPGLETLVMGKVRRWRFGKIDKPGDITEVVYPFVFNQ